MIDIEKAKQEFKKYVESYNINEVWIGRKFGHSFRVMEQSKNIAESLNLSKEEIGLATLIGLLHDIARFKQWTEYQTFTDRKSFDHGDCGVEILEKDSFIRKFIEEDKYDEIIKIAIKNHNKYQIENGIEGEKLLQSKIIRDADKIDIFSEALEFFWDGEGEKENIENSEISEEYFNQFVKRSPILRNPNQTPLDSVISLIAFIFDLNFDYSKGKIYENNYINKILDKFDYKDAKTREKVEVIREVANNYLKESL